MNATYKKYGNALDVNNEEIFMETFNPAIHGGVYTAVATQVVTGQKETGSGKTGKEARNNAETKLANKILKNKICGC